MKRTLALLGLRCAGKTTVGRALAAELSLPFLDLDERTLIHARQAGLDAPTAGALLTRAGEATFRHFEAAALRAILEPELRLVLATGGGVVERADNRTWLARCATCIYLDVPIDVAAARLRADSAERPALRGGDPAEELAELATRRIPYYRALAEFSVGAGPPDPETTLELLKLIRMPEAARFGSLGHPRS